MPLIFRWRVREEINFKIRRRLRAKNHQIKQRRTFNGEEKRKLTSLATRNALENRILEATRLDTSAKIKTQPSSHTVTRIE